MATVRCRDTATVVGAAVRPDRRAVCSPVCGGAVTEDRRRPIAQWFNPAFKAALLVAPETSPEWPVQRFGIFYAPPDAGFVRVHSAPHEWNPRQPRRSPTEQEAFLSAVAEAEMFLQVEMDFV